MEIEGSNQKWDKKGRTPALSDAIDHDTGVGSQTGKGKWNMTVNWANFANGTLLLEFLSGLKKSVTNFFIPKKCRFKLRRISLFEYFESLGLKIGLSCFLLKR